MNRLFNEKEEYTDEAQEVSRRFRALIKPFIDELEDSSYEARDIELLLCGDIRLETLGIILGRRINKKIR